MLAPLAVAAFLTVSLAAEEPPAAAPAEAAPVAAQAKWEVKAESKGVVVHARAKAGSDIKELKTVGEIDSPPAAVFRVLTDFEAYKEAMPYTEESQVLDTEEVGGKKAWYFYSLINAPLASRRDYTIRVADQSDWRDGKGFMKTYWEVSAKGPEPKEGVVRVKVNTGSWLLEPIKNGTQTRATYYLFTDPGGSLPTWIANKANSSAIPDIFVALRKLAKQPKYAEGKK